MADQVYECIDQLRQLIQNMNVNEEEEHPLIKNENVPGHAPGQVTNEGDIIFTYRTTQNEQYSKYNVHGRIYQEILKSQNCLLLNVYNSNGIYLCEHNYMKTKIFTFMQQTKAYCLIEELQEKNPTCVQQHLDHIFEEINTLLDDLIKSHCINNSQFLQMKVERSQVRMNYLFFLPDLRHVSSIFLLVIFLFISI